MTDSESSGPIVSWDFARSFPHKIWVSNWSSDESYPNGFRYKFFSTRNVGDDFIETVLVMEEPGELKTERKRMDVRTDKFDDVVGKFLGGLEEKFGIEFELQDLSAVRTPEEFEKAIKELGWHEPA